MAYSAVLKGIPVVPGASAEQRVIFTGDAAYPNPAGYVINAGTFGFNVLKRLYCPILNSVASAAWRLVLVPTFSTDGNTITSAALHLIVSSTDAEVANGVDVSAFVCTLIGEGN